MRARVDEERMVVAAFTEAELRRLHALLGCYESPFCAAHEADEHAWDLRAHEALRRHIATLLPPEDSADDE